MTVCCQSHFLHLSVFTLVIAVQVEYVDDTKVSSVDKSLVSSVSHSLELYSLLSGTKVNTAMHQMSSMILVLLSS